MQASYNKLWKLLIDKNMKKKDLRLAANISTSLITKLGNNESVTIESLLRICEVLDCNIGDIVDAIPD